MYKTRKINTEGADERKLLEALRELHDDGVRIYTGTLPPEKVLERKVEEPLQDTSAGSALKPELVQEPVGGNPYDHDLS